MNSDRIFTLTPGEDKIGFGKLVGFIDKSTATFPPSIRLNSRTSPGWKARWMHGSTSGIAYPRCMNAGGRLCCALTPTQPLASRCQHYGDRRWSGQPGANPAFSLNPASPQPRL